MTKASKRVVDYIVDILWKENIRVAFGVPGGAINPLYDAMSKDGKIKHILARHVEGASHMAEGYSRASKSSIGLCLGTSGPGATDMITGLYSAYADSIPILCITGQVNSSDQYKEAFQSVDIVSIAKPVTKFSIQIECADLAPSYFQKAFWLMRSGRPGPVLIDIPIDIQNTKIFYDIDSYEPLEIHYPKVSKKQLDKIFKLLEEAKKPIIVAGGGVVSSNSFDTLNKLAIQTNIPVSPTLMGKGCLPDNHKNIIGMIGTQIYSGCANTKFNEADLIIGLGNRWANRHTGNISSYIEKKKFIHVDIEPTQIGRVIAPELGIVSDVKYFLSELIKFIDKKRKESGNNSLLSWESWLKECQNLKKESEEKRAISIESLALLDKNITLDVLFDYIETYMPKKVLYVTSIGHTQIAASKSLSVNNPKAWINCGQAGPLGWTLPAAIGAKLANKNDILVVGISGDYDFQFMIEELAVAAQYKLGYIHFIVNNTYLGLIRQDQLKYGTEYEVYLGFHNINSSECDGIDHIKVIEGLGARGERVFNLFELKKAISNAKKFILKNQLPYVIEVIVEKNTELSFFNDIGSTIK